MKKTFSKIEIIRKFSKSENEKISKNSKFLQIFLIFFLAKVALYKSSSLYPISRDEFRTTVTMFFAVTCKNAVFSWFSWFSVGFQLVWGTLLPGLPPGPPASWEVPHSWGSKSRMVQQTVVWIKDSEKYKHSLAEKRGFVLKTGHSRSGYLWHLGWGGYGQDFVGLVPTWSLKVTSWWKLLRIGTLKDLDCSVV